MALMSSSRETFFMIFLLWQVKQKNPWLRSRCQLDYGPLGAPWGERTSACKLDLWMLDDLRYLMLIGQNHNFLTILASLDGVHRTAKELSKRMTQVEARDIEKPCNTDKNLTPLTYCTLWRCLWVLPMLKGSELHNVLMWDILYHWGCCYRHQPSKPKCRTETIGRPYLPCALAVSAKRAGIKILKIMNKSRYNI